MLSCPELLSPAGSLEALKYAVMYGADAVYCALPRFGMRAAPVNLTIGELHDGCIFAHARGKKVYLTLNNLPTNDELSELPQYIKDAAEAGVDAFIIADLGVLSLAKQYAPDVDVHFSTQAGITNYAAATMAYNLGAKRVVLARELTLTDIAQIRDNTPPELELEAFVHGAMCMSVSGRCLLSSYMTGRSGNRGSCAGPCRLPFEANPLPEGKPGRLHHLSLKDNSVIDKLDRMQAVGGASAKIEGRLRTPEYVAAAVSACLAGREGRAYDRDLLKNAFSRSGFTSGYLDGKIDGTMFGVRSEADAEQTKKTLPMLRELYRRERSRVPVQMKLELEEGGEKLTVTDGQGNKAFA